MQVKAFKLTTGDEIIAFTEVANTPSLIAGDVIVEGKTTYKLIKVRAVVLQGGPNGQIGFAMLPWIASNPDMEIELPEKMIAFEVKPLSPVEEAYVAQNSTVKPARADQIPTGKIQLK